MDNETYEKLKQDEHYYGEFGKKFLSNSNIKVLLEDPGSLHKETPNNPNFVVGSYFHTLILEPEKASNFKIIDATNRNTKKYKEESNGEVVMLRHEADNVLAMVDAVMNNDTCHDMIKPILNDVVYEEPGVKDIFGNLWKGKADIINHEYKVVVDLKTTGDINNFKWSANKYNYDSQAFIYKEIFGYDMVFIAIDKKTHNVGVFDCSNQFYDYGAEKVTKATEIYNMFYKDNSFDNRQFFINKTL